MCFQKNSTKSAYNSIVIQQQLKHISQTESKHSAWKIMLFTFLTVVVLLVSVLKGSQHLNPLNIECGSLMYWLLSLSIVPFVIGICIGCRKYLLKKFDIKENLIAYGLFEYADGDVHWNEINTIRYPLICSIAGLCAGMFGIGGGIIKGPLMLEMRILPAVASATAATMILFTSFAATVAYLTYDEMNVRFAPFLFITGFVSALIGRTTLNYFVEKYKRQSFIAIIIGLTVVGSTIAMTAAAVTDIVHNGDENANHIC